jgi:nitrate reductase alpha subunit
LTATPHIGGTLEELLERSGRFFTPGEVSADLRIVTRRGGREGDVFYRDRWSHDKVVRSTHGVNCPGSCSWKIYVKDGIITWETQQTDYPSVGPDRPEYEPRGCPRGRIVLLVQLFTDPGALSVRARRAGGDVPRGQGTAG